MRCLALLLVLLAAPASVLAADAGDVIFSELMIKTQGGAEWVEVLNTTGEAQSLDDCIISDGTSDVSLNGVEVPAGGYALFANNETCVAWTDAATNTCAVPADLSYSSLGLNDSGNETLTLECAGVTVDEVTYDWDDLEDDCVGAQTCSGQVIPGAENAASNDSWPDNWCVPPATSFTFDGLGREMLATPGAVSVCPSSGPPCGEGDAVFTELMIAPPSSTREWFEITVTSAAGCDLHGCELREGPVADPLGDPGEDGWGIHTIDAAGNTLPIAVGDYALFAKSADTVVGDPDDPEETDFVVADYRYGTSIGFSNSEPGYLHLLCGGVPVDSVPYDWERFEAGCADGGCSVNLLPSREQVDTNDDLVAWCLPPDEPTRPSSTGDPITGTPGAPGVCQERIWPGPGQVLFTELMGMPSSGQTGTSIPEFFELTNLGEGAADLTSCRIARQRLDREAGTYAPTSTSNESIFGTEAEATVLEPGASAVWSRNLCLDGGDPELASCTGDELLYSGIEFSNSERERLELLCPDGAGGEVLVDLAEYDFTRSGVRGAHSVEFDPSVADAGSLNDEPTAWCEASFYDCYATNGEGQCNFGTPGVAGACKTSQQSAVESGVPGCRCDVAEPGSVGWFGALFGVVFAARRRKRE